MLLPRNLHLVSNEGFWCSVSGSRNWRAIQAVRACDVKSSHLDERGFLQIRLSRPPGRPSSKIFHPTAPVHLPPTGVTQFLLLLPRTLHFVLVAYPTTTVHQISLSRIPVPPQTEISPQNFSVVGAQEFLLYQLWRHCRQSPQGQAWEPTASGWAWKLPPTPKWHLGAPSRNAAQRRTQCKWLSQWRRSSSLPRSPKRLSTLPRYDSGSRNLSGGSRGDLLWLGGI